MFVRYLLQCVRFARRDRDVRAFLEQQLSRLRTDAGRCTNDPHSRAAPVPDAPIHAAICRLIQHRLRVV
jgi:hypothetical protein